MIVIMSPTKTFREQCKQRELKGSELIFKEENLELINILKEYSEEDLSKLMKISLELSCLNVYRIKEFYSGNLKENYAIDFFYGEAFKGLNSEELSNEDLIYSQGVLRILSGLYGVIRPLDIIKEYRLEMGTKFKNEKYKDLYTFWKEKITINIMEDIENSLGENILVNLASDEYSRALDFKKINSKYGIVNIVFKENKNGQYKVVGTYAKKARGLMLRYIIQNRIETVEKIKEFNADRYRFNEELSNEKELVFTR